MRLKFSNSSSFTTLDLYEYTLDSERILAAYACLNGNFKLYNVTCDPQNKIVSSKKFKALLDSKTNIGIIYDGYKKISGSVMVYNISTCSFSYKLDQFRIKLLNN
ncbi:hypothetical protein C2G38_2168832 [Gigaspora rosea]|uniref:Uncharacterized protein n=1 Tax=Gigaspora rosea TaxID=44941 RepID=A0A397VPE0_9GLOM|nr:hypothetical protein C2G38_2168832 [Gigaspora rosea]